MTNDQLLGACKLYRTYFERKNIKPVDLKTGEASKEEHCCWMAFEIPKLLADGHREKADRWLGFLQGVLWTLDHFVLNELRQHNRTKER